LIALVQKRLSKPPVSPEGLKGSLGRILDVGQPSVPPVPHAKQVAASKTGDAKKRKGKDYSLDHHLSGKPAAIVDMFEQIDEFGRSLGPDVSRRITKYYIGYFVGKRSFFTVEVRRQRLILFRNLDPTTTSPWNDKAMRDVREIGHYGMGDTEFSLREPGQVEEAKAVVRQAHLKTK
jgi:predicted transport protein